MSPPSYARAARKLGQAQRIEARLAQWWRSLRMGPAWVRRRYHHLSPKQRRLTLWLAGRWSALSPSLVTLLPALVSMLALCLALALSACGTALLPAGTCPPVPAALLTPPQPPVLLTPKSASKTPGTTRPPTPQPAAPTVPGWPL